MISLQGKKRFSLSIKLINISFVVTVILVSVLTIITDAIIQSKQDKASEFQKMYLACDDAANILQKESDLLTLSISNYVDTMEQSSIEEYYEIIDKRLREKEIEKAEKYNVDCTTIREALELSNELAKREARAFALIASANNNMDEMPIQVRESSLSKAELGLSKAQKIKAAQKLIHCKEYNVYKRYIYEKISKFEKEVLNKTEERVLAKNDEIKSSIITLHIVVMIGVVLVIIISIILYRKVTVVLGKYVESISNNEYIEEKGTSELRYLASEFNKYLDIKNKEEMKLRQRADVDPLTQVASRRALEEFVTNKLNQENSKGAFIFLDVDDFKNINDAYGHDVGDEILKRLANELKARLRRNNFTGRFGGDEFVVWLDGLDENDIEYVKTRLDNLNNALLNSNDLSVGFSISAGIYFCKSGEKYEDVLKYADSALYEKKRNGKKGYAFYNKEF